MKGEMAANIELLYSSRPLHPSPLCEEQHTSNACGVSLTTVLMLKFCTISPLTKCICYLKM